jgi:hypothetical protein
MIQKLFFDLWSLFFVLLMFGAGSGAYSPGVA